MEGGMDGCQVEFLVEADFTMKSEIDPKRKGN
jgi:hypothetical protein